MGDIHYIVDKLNAPPFQHSLSLLTFSEKGPSELLQLLSDVFAQITPKSNHVDVSNETADHTADRLLQFLKTVKYKPPTDATSFRQLLVAGDKDAVYPILKWVVPQPQVLEKRAFIGYYLSMPDMPEEFNFDPDVMEVKEEIKQLQLHFVELHRSSDGVKALTKDTQAVKVKIKGLEEEKERLTDKVERARQQVERVPDKGSYIEVCASLRKQQDSEVAQANQIATQRQNLQKQEGVYNKATTRLREMQSSFQEGSAGRVLETIASDVNSLRSQVNERYPKELEKRQKRQAALGEALANGVNTELDLQRLQSQAQGLLVQVAEIQERRAALDRQRAGDKSFLQMRQAQGMAQKVAQKKEELSVKMERLQEKKSSLTASVDKLAAHEGSIIGRVSEEEWGLKYESLKSKLPAFKKMKKELGDIEAEVFTLSHTEELLSQQEGIFADGVKKIERKQGVTGFTDVAAHLEKVSEAKSVMDEEKGMTLAEISRTVEDINAAINERKTRLAPQLKKLRAVRATFSELEGEHNDKKAAYDAAVAQYEGRTGALETEVTALRSGMMDDESRFHLLHCQLAVADANIKKIISAPTAEMLKDRYQTKIVEAEESSKALRDRQRDIKDNHTTGLSQIDMMNDLIKLLQLKMALHRQAQGLPASAYPSLPPPTQSFETATANVMVL
ncbi:MAG: hypothetical protein WDW36_002278 [Sanguina aurantia]